MVNSLRRDLEEYKVTTEKHDAARDYTTANIPAQHMNDEIIPNTVFILNYTRFDDHSFVENIAKELTDYTVYTSYVHRERFPECSHITFVKRDSKKFYSALYSSQYIIVDAFLNAYFIPREGQTVITNIDLMTNDDLANITEWNKNILRSNIVTCSTGDVQDKFNSLFPANASFKGGFIKGNDIVKYIKGEDVEITKPVIPSKKRVLIATMFTKGEKWLPMLCNYLEQVDYSNTEITLVLDKRHISVISRFLIKFIDRITFVSRAGWFLITEDQRKIYDYFNVDLAYFENIDSVFNYIPKDLFKRELTRTVSSTEFDCVLLYGERSASNNYWINICRSIEAKEKHIVYDINMYKHTNEEPEVIDLFNKNVTSLYMTFNNIWFWDNGQLEGFKEKATASGLDISKNNLSIMSMLPTKDLNYDTTVVDFNRDKYIVYNDYFTDSLKLEVAKLPLDINNTVAIVLENDSELIADGTDAIQAYFKANIDKEIIVFDTNHVLASIIKPIIDDLTNVTLWRGATYYYVYLNYINKYIISSKSTARIEELQSLGKEITYTLN